MKKSLRRPFRAEIVRRILNERKAKMLFFQRLHTKTNGRKYNQNTPGFSMKKPATRAGSDGLVRLDASAIEKLIFPVGFFRNKARHLSLLPAALAGKFEGQVPSAIDDLLTLPGVGRKTANLVRSVAFGLPAICVDTHVHRIMNIWAYVATDTPLATEMALREKLPEKYWIRINGLLVAFGQSICRPVAPHCDACQIGRAHV